MKKNFEKLIEKETEDELEEVYSILNTFIDKTIIVSVIGSVTVGQALHNFKWRQEEDISRNKYIMLYFFPGEDFISIDIRKIADYFVDENEVILKMDNGTLVQISYEE